MSRFISERRLTHVSLSYFATLLAVAFGFRALQNHIGVIGGEIALSKLIWLAYAITFWIALPMLIVMDARTPTSIRKSFRYLLAWMLLRAVAEMVMLYVTKNWSPIYGIAHDVICMAGMLLLLAPSRSAITNRLSFTVWLHGIVTATLFLPEIYFAWYMHTHFNTQGSHAVYFVPDSVEHRRVLFVTGVVDIVLAVYLPIFLMRWLNVKTDRTTV